MTSKAGVSEDTVGDGKVPGVEALIAENEFTDGDQITDTTSGRRFVDMHGKVVRYAVDTGHWFVWSDVGHWQEEDVKTLRVFALTQRVITRLREEALEIDDDAVRRRTLTLVTAQESVRKRRDVLHAAAADPRIQLHEEDFDAVPHELTVQNGVVDLNTGTLRSARPGDLAARCCRTRLVPTATETGYAPELDLFMETFLPNPAHQRFVFALLGDSLRGGNQRRLLPIFWGPTTTGKSQLWEALHHLLDGYACTIGSGVFRGNLDDKPRPDLVHAMFTRVAYASEAAKNWALHADQVKRLTGGDALPYRNLFEGVVNRKPRFTPFIVANEFPRITGADVATKRRVLAIRFERSLSPGDEDPSVKERFLADPRTYEGLLARLVAGARDDIMNYPENWPEEYTLATMAARANIDHTEEFVEWARDEGLLVFEENLPGTACVKASVLHSIYTYWLKKHGTDVEHKDRLGIKDFGQALRDKGWQSVKSAGVRWVGWRTPETLPMWISI